MKISFIEPHLKQFGGIRRVIEISNRLVDRGYDVTIFHSDGEECQWMEGKAKTKPAKLVLNEKHDVLIFNHPALDDTTLAIKTNARLKIKYVLGLWDKDLLRGFNVSILLPKNFNMFILKKMLSSPYLKLSNASWEKKWLEDYLKIHSELLIGGINRDHFYPIIRDSINTDNSIHILCSGDPRLSKGTENIKTAFERVRKEEPRVTLDTYHGQGIPQEDMGKKYSSADIFVEASLHAGWNNPVVEAMACGVPVVCTDIGGVRDFAFHRKTALLVPPNDPETLACAILELINNKELRRNLRENALQFISRFDWDKCVDELEDIIDAELIKEKSVRDKIQEISYKYLTLVQLYFLKVFHAILRIVYKLFKMLLRR